MAMGRVRRIGRADVARLCGGKAPEVPEGSAPPKVLIELASMQSMMSPLAMTPPMARPLPIPLANVTMSGAMP